MCASPTVRVVFEVRSGREWEFRTSDLSEFSEIVGKDLLRWFCCCLIHADRINSLAGMLELSRREFPKGSVGERRNFLTFCYFLAGSLKEYALQLGKLRGALVRRSLFDLEAWARDLKRWEDWGRDPANSLVRNKLAFHIDPRIVEQGLDKLAHSGPETLFAGDDRLLRNSWFKLAHEAQIEGLALNVEDAAQTIGAPAALMDVHSALQTEFLRVIEQLGLKPLICKVSGARVPLEAVGA